MAELKISDSIKKMRYSVIREMGQMAMGMEDSITLGIGEPDLDTPAAVTAQAFEDARNGHTHYTPNQGDPELVKKLSLCLTREMGMPVPPASILVTHGAMGGLVAAFRTLLDPGEEVIVIEPHYPDYLAQIAFARGEVKAVETRFEDGFIPTPEAIEAAITPKTRIILLNSPNNPTGAVIPGEVLDRIAEIAIRHNLVVISDEVYDRISFAEQPESIYTRKGMADRTLVVNSFSKTYAMTGWRIGFTFGPDDIISQMLKVISYSTSCASSVGQRAALAALDRDPEILREMAQTFERRVDLVCSRLSRMPGVRFVRPKGTFYVFADISAVSLQSRQFAVTLLEKEQLVVVPGYAFGKSCDSCIRIACTLPQKRLNQAMDRLESHMKRLREV